MDHNPNSVLLVAFWTFAPNIHLYPCIRRLLKDSSDVVTFHLYVKILFSIDQQKTIIYISKKELRFRFRDSVKNLIFVGAHVQVSECYD